MTTRAAAVVVVLLGLALPLKAQVLDTGPITLACGGIGKDDSERMLALQPAHALTLIFAAADGSYLTAVPTQIDAPLHGLSVARACGPIGQVDVPVAGQYRIRATHEGRSIERWLELAPGGGARQVLRW